MTKLLPEFPTEWHQERYVEDLKRELAGAELRGDEAYAENVKAELDRVQGQASKPGRPKKTAKAG